MSKETVKQQWEKVKELYTEEFNKVTEIRKAWIQINECKYCGAIDEQGKLVILVDPHSITFQSRLKDIDILVQLQSFPLRIKTEYCASEKSMVVPADSTLFYFPDKLDEYSQLETIVCECSESELMWDEDGTYIVQTPLDPDYYTLNGKVDTDDEEVKRFMNVVKGCLEYYGWGFEDVDGTVHHHKAAYNVVECRFRTWKDPVNA